MESEIKTYWNNRANLGFLAGTNDVILKKLEIATISQFAADNIAILDIGCGNGITAVELASRYCSMVTGIDFAENMITEALKLAKKKHLNGPVNFQVGDILELPQTLGKFNMVYTERVLINLPDWPSQIKAISSISGLLLKGGLYVMCESSQDGLDKINFFRGQLNLPRISQPWHNCYMEDTKISNLRIPGLVLEKKIDFTSTYYFLSRVVNAYIAMQEDKEPDYEAPVNQLALKLPAMGDMGQTKIWLWRRV